MYPLLQVSLPFSPASIQYSAEHKQLLVVEKSSGVLYVSENNGVNDVTDLTWDVQTGCSDADGFIFWNPASGVG